MCAGRTLPWLQDTLAEQAWNAWGVITDEVVIVDRNNVAVDGLNLLASDLTIAANYQAFKARIKAAAGE